MQVEKRPTTEELVSTKPARSFPRPLFILVALIGLAVFLTVLVYALPVTNPVARAIAAVLPYPAATVNGTIITLHDYINEYDALQKYLRTSTASEQVSEQAMQQTILDALVNKAAIRELAMREGVRLDTERVRAFYQDVVGAEESEEAFASELKETYGWTTDQFQERIIESIVLALQMSEYVLDNEAMQAEGRAKIDAELASPGTLPAEDIGVYPLSEIPEEWSSVKDLPVGGRTGILESEIWYMIFEMAERTEAGGEAQLHLKAVNVPKVTLEDRVKAYLDGAKVRYFVK